MKEEIFKSTNAYIHEYLLLSYRLDYFNLSCIMNFILRDSISIIMPIYCLNKGMNIDCIFNRVSNKAFKFHYIMRIFMRNRCFMVYLKFTFVVCDRAKLIGLHFSLNILNIFFKVQEVYYYTCLNSWELLWYWFLKYLLCNVFTIQIVFKN
jgi:hypothetical protein